MGVHAACPEPVGVSSDGWRLLSVLRVDALPNRPPVLQPSFIQNFLGRYQSSTTPNATSQPAVRHLADFHRHSRVKDHLAFPSILWMEAVLAVQLLQVVSSRHAFKALYFLLLLIIHN